MAKLDLDSELTKAWAKLLALDTPWWQAKKHRSGGKTVHTVLIQNKSDVRRYHKGSDENLVAAINVAVANFEKNVAAEYDNTKKERQ